MSPATASRRGGLLPSVLALVLALAGGGRAVGQEEVRSLVLTVMPFRTLAGPELAFLGDSFSEALTTKLVGLRDIKVYERSQFDRLAGELKLEKDAAGFFDQSSLARMGAVVSIDYALLGSVTAAGAGFTCAARLVHVNSGKVMLAREFKGSYPAELFRVQDQVSLAVAESLSLRLDEFELKRLSKRPTENADAFTLYNKSLAMADVSARVKLLESAVARDPSFTVARHLLADARLELGSPGGAIAEYKAILGTDPGDYRAAYNLGLLLLDEGRVAEARSRFAACAELKPGDADAAYHLGLTWEFGADGQRLGEGSDLEAATQLYRKAARIDPLHRESRLAGGILNAALAQALEEPAARLERLRLSAELLGEWLALAPEDPQAQEIGANLELLRRAVKEHEEWLAGQAKGGG